MKLPVYLDYAATTPADRRVVDKMLPYLAEEFGNAASSSHAYGWAARRAVDDARRQVAALIGASPAEVVWTSGATEANNLAIKGAAKAKSRGAPGHIVTVQTEHKAVLDAVRFLEQAEGFSVTCLAPAPSGLVDPALLESSLRPDTVLVSVMMVNNEIGVIQPVEEIGAICRRRGIVFHCDAVQAAAKLPIDVGKLSVDLLTLTAHKMYGPKGIGALYVCASPRVAVEPLIHGGGHEGGLRSGTLPVHQIVGFGEAARIAAQEMHGDTERIARLRARLLTGLQELNGMSLNGDARARVPHNLNLAFRLDKDASLLARLEDIAVSAGSACASGESEPSHVLRAIGCPDELAHNSIRISLGRWTTEEEVDFAAGLIRREATRLGVRSS